MGPTFFGLGPSDRDIFLEPAFILIHYMGLSFTECYNIPIAYRRWFIQRLNRENEKRNDSVGDSAGTDSSPGTFESMERAIQNARMELPSGLRKGG